MNILGTTENTTFSLNTWIPVKITRTGSSHTVTVDNVDYQRTASVDTSNVYRVYTTNNVQIRNVKIKPL